MKNLARKAFNFAASRLTFGRKPILIVGHGRSGTSWVGSVFAQSPGALYYHEPCQPRGNSVDGFSKWFKYVPPTEGDAELQACLRPVFAGLIPPWGRPLPRDKVLLRRLLPGFQVIVKEVATLMCVGWIYNHFQPRILLVVRHPCGVALSESRKNTPTTEAMHEILQQPKLIQNHLEPYLAVFEEAKQPFEMLGTIWGARHRVVADQLAGHPEWVIVTYEALCEQPYQTFARLFHELDLRWTSTVEDFITATTTQHKPGTYSVYRVAREQAYKWRSALSKFEIEQVRRFVEPFQLPFYNQPSDWM